MRFVVQVRPFHCPHHEADVLIYVKEDDNVARLQCWLESNQLKTETHRLDNADYICHLGTADRLAYTLDELSGCVSAVLRNTIQNDKRIFQKDSLALPP